jgi:hypothetical protein
MNLNEKAWHARLFNVIYTRSNLPKNFCNYFWTIILLLVTMPLYFPGLLLRLPKELRIDFRGPAVTIGGFLINFYLLVCGLIANDLGKTFELSFALSFVIAFLGLTIAVALIFLIAYLLGEKLPNKLKSNDNIIGMTSEYFKAKKEAYCPKIEWRKNENSKRDNTE